MLLREAVKLTVFDGGLTLEKQLDFTGVDTDSTPEQLYQKLGLKPYRIKVAPIIDEVVDGKVAKKAGLKPGDKVLSAANQPIRDWDDLVKVVSTSPGKSITLVILRNGREMTFEIVPEAVDGPSGKIGQIGVVAKEDPSQRDSLRTKMRYDTIPAFSARQMAS